MILISRKLCELVEESILTTGETDEGFAAEFEVLSDPQANRYS